MAYVQIGDTVAERYLVKRRLGSGGMGEVFLVDDLQTGEERALKTLHEKFSQNKQAVARFTREVRASSRLNHPGIVKIFDARVWNSTLFYVMEYVDGKSLRHWHNQRGRLPLSSVVRVLCLIADALGHAHRITIHRDLSPENIMVMGDGSVRLLDFGLAKMDDNYKDLTMVGVHLGKIFYMAPEQQVNASKVDRRADIYPLGIMFFEMLTGKLPKYKQQITAFCPELPPEADAFFAKAVASNSEERFQSAAAFRDELLRVYKIAEGEIPSTLRQSRPMLSNMLPFGQKGEHTGVEKPAVPVLYESAWLQLVKLFPRLMSRITGRRVV